MESYIVSPLRDTIMDTDTWYFITSNIPNLKKKLRNVFAQKIVLNEILKFIHNVLQGFKESTSARYLFLCLKLASNKVPWLCDSITQTWFSPDWWNLYTHKLITIPLPPKINPHIFLTKNFVLTQNGIKKKSDPKLFLTK